jgi:hypothetical protein
MTLQEAYGNGFVEKCAEAGVDPESLVKFAEATPLSDFLGAMVGSLVPHAGPLATGIGASAGLLSDDFKEHDSSKLKAFIPGVGGYRLGRRLSSQVKHEQEDARKLGRKDVSPVAHATAERLGQLTSILASTALGGGLGAMVNKKDRGKGFRVGAGLGAGAASLANLGGLIAAGVKRRRTKEEQLDADSESTLDKYLVPGLATYGASKRMGRSQGDRDENPENKKKGDKGKEKKASALVKSAYKKTWLDDIANAYGRIDPITRRALITGLATGAGTFMLSNGETGERALKGLAGGLLGGGALYGLDSAGLTDKGIDAVRDLLVQLKTKPSWSDRAGRQMRKWEQAGY